MKTKLLKIFNVEHTTRTWDVWSFKIDGKFYDIYTNIHQPGIGKRRSSWAFAVDKPGGHLEGNGVLDRMYVFPTRCLMELQRMLNVKK